MSSFKTACYSLVCELKRQNRHVPALAIASAINERLNSLHATSSVSFPGGDSQAADHRNLMFSESARRETFAKWPHMDYKWALPDQMAQAGFFHQPNATGDDRAMCFTCTVCLVCWEPTDEPWAEHERHSPCCPFVKGEYTQNVPLSVTYATAPALGLTHTLSPDVGLVDISSLPGYLSVCATDATVIVLNFVHQLKIENEFSVSKLCNDSGLSHSELVLSSTAIASHVKHGAKTSESLDEENVNRTVSGVESSEAMTDGSDVPRPCLLVGVRMRTTGEEINQLKQRLEAGGSPLIDTEMNPPTPSACSEAFLLVMDFHYRPYRCSNGTRSLSSGVQGNKKAVSGTGTSTATGGGGKLIQWEKQGMYHHPLIDEIMDDDFLVTSSPTAVEYMQNEPPQPSTSNSNSNSTDVTHSELKKELWSILEKSDFCTTSLKKLRLLLESKLNCDLSQRLLEFGEIVQAYLEEFNKKETGGMVPSEFYDSLMNLDSVAAGEQGVGGFEGFEGFDNYSAFDSLDTSGSFSFGHPSSIKSLETIDTALNKLLDSALTRKKQSAGGVVTGAGSPGASCKSVPGLVQIIQVPSSSSDITITGIHPLSDYLHVLVILSDGSLHLYSLYHTGKVVTLSSSPLKSHSPSSPKEGLSKAILLPPDQSCNVLAGITLTGSLVLMDVLTLTVLSHLDPAPDQEFVTLTYCNSLERICVATSKGCLRFYALRDDDELRLREDASSSPVMKKKANLNQANAASNISDSLIVNRLSYGLPELRTLYSLTLFETLSPGYSAAVPPCWSELMQAQKQRRHAQHLTREDIHTRSWRLQNDLTTWGEHMFELSLPKNTCVGQVDVKLTLHTPCPQVPHLQVTLLRPITSRAPFQASHNAQAAAAGYTSTPVDAGVSFSLPNEDPAVKANSVQSDFYSNTEVLSGPVNISNCLDLSDQSCTISFSSPKLLQTKNRQLLVHIKALSFNMNTTQTPHKTKSKDKDSPTSSKVTSSTSSSSIFGAGKPTGMSAIRNYLFGTTGPSGSTSKKSESFIGCDWIHEISITIRKSKPADIPNERLERMTMIECSTVVEKLLRSIIKSGDHVIQSIALDILIWIAVIRLGRLRTSQDPARATQDQQCQEQQFQFVKLIESQLGDFLHTCFIQSGRSIARKAAKFLIICSDGMKDATDASKVRFDVTLLKVLVDLLPYICMSWSAGSVRWLFQMLNKVMSLDTTAVAAHRCLDILNAIGAQLTARQNPYHLILRTRFGLHGTPLEPELFEYEPYIPSKFQSVPVGYTPVMAGEGPWVSANNNSWPVSINNNPGAASSNVPGTGSNANSSPQWIGLSSEPLDWRELLIPPTEGKGAPRVKGITVNHYMKGLLEVEPLHFTCHAMSDGTKLEKIDPQPVNPLFHMYSGGAKTRSTQWNVADNCIVVDMAPDQEMSKFPGGDGKGQQGVPSGVFSTISSSFSPYVSLSAGGSTGVAGGESKIMTSGDFFKSFTSQQGGGVYPLWGTHDSMDASTSTPLETSSTATTSSTYTGVASQDDQQAGSGSISWSQLLSPPPQQVMVIERMHSGARRFLVLDFGRPILLTDLLIPACSELLSLSIDIWNRSEEADAIRLVVTPDIALKNLILSDIQPPPICRYLKITTIGRYGMSTAKCKIPVGSYYGHTLVLPGEDYADKNAGATLCETNIKAQLQLLSSLHEDIYCRYSLCCTKLKEYMTPLLVSETPNVVHMHRYFNRKKENNLFLPEPKDKIISCYKECVTYQHQLNVVKSVIRRLSPPVVTKNDPLVLAGSSDKLRLIGECLLDSVLYYVYEIGPIPSPPPTLSLRFDEPLCSRLFSSFCITEDTRLQVATAALLVATCGPHPWWGDFLVRRFCDLYSSQQSLIFPQDRILMLFSWLGRKNLTLCSSLVDSLLRALLTHLAPLAHASPITSSQHNSSSQNTSSSSQTSTSLGTGVNASTSSVGGSSSSVGTAPGFLRSNTDLSLITWLLLFLSQVLDCSCGDSPPQESNKPFGTRWDFMCGELAMQKQKLKPKASNSTSRNNRNRRLQKKLMNQSTSHMNDLIEHKKPHLSDFLSEAKKSSIISDLMEHKKSHHNKDSSDKASKSSSSSGGSTSKNSSECLVTPLISLPRQHCLPSARAILAFVLHLDYTCNVDTFLVACKDLSRIIISTRPSLTLPELLSESELLHLLRLAVWSDQHRSVWGGPWTLHALTCLLLDMLDAQQQGGQPVNSQPSGSTSASGVEDNASAPTATSSQASSTPTPVTPSGQGSSGSGVNTPSTLAPEPSPTLSPYVLPSVLESDDSDLEDFLDDILERGRILVHKVPSFVPKSSMGGISCSMSQAMDSRLEYGVENNAEVTLKRLTAQSAYNLPISIQSPLPHAAPGLDPNDVNAMQWDDGVTQAWTRDETPLTGHQMLSNCFNTLFCELDSLTGWSNIEQILELWLTLNGSGKSSSEECTGRRFNPSHVPEIVLSTRSISTLIHALTLRPNVSLRTWCLSFETLTLATNTPCDTTLTNQADNDAASALVGMARVIIDQPSFLPMMFTFMSSSQLKSNQLAGPSVCLAFRQFLVRLQARCDILSFSTELNTGTQLKEHLLSLLYMLVQNKGPLTSQAGPLDVQCEFVQHLLHLHFSAYHLPTAMSILESVGMLLYSYVTSLDTLKCLSVNEASVNNPLSCFHNAWSSLLSSAPSTNSSTSSSDSAKLLKLPSHQTLMLNLLRFATKLVQIPLDERNGGGGDQTDESKAEQQLFQTPCLADVVLRHNTSMEHLLTSLASSSSSSFAMILSSSNNLLFTDNFEPSCVGDGVFQLLVTLTSKASTRSLALTPILEFLSNWNNSSRGVFQLSEPFVWLLMKCLNTAESVQELVNLGGVTVLCRGLIQSHSLVINPHPSQVSVLMQHLSQFPAYNMVGSGNTPSSSKKVNSPPVPDSWTYPPKLINFAPLGTISTPNPASQTPEVLIQSTPPHRRARSPAWSYHFFSDESSVELTITLPCAILLKEIQLQPHVSALCTCPSAVGLEVCHGLGTGMVPVGPPLETAGLTFIRLNLPSPEVVTGVLLRLYRAKDSASLGLTQIRVIGATSFGDTAFQMCNAAIPDETKLTKSSIGWLRVLNHVISVPNPDSPLLFSLLDAASSTPSLLDSLASLLLLPAPPPALFAPGLKHVLLSLGLHSKALGLSLLEILLHNGAVTFMQGTLPLGKNTTASLESVVELIYMLCTTQDACTLDRLTLLLNWLRTTAEACLKESTHLPPTSMYIHCASVVLWSLQERGVLTNELQTLVSDELFLSVYAWTLQVKEESALKTSLDNVLCSMCYIRPCLFSTLLAKMAILVPAPLDSASISDDRKDYSDLTDDSKGQAGTIPEDTPLVLCELRQLKVSESQLMTVAIASQSPAATATLLNSGLPARLANAVLEYCLTTHHGSSVLTDSDKATNHHNGLTLNAHHVGTILKFFTSLCSTALMKDWLGTPEGSVFWLPLLSYLDAKTSENPGFGYSWELSSVIPHLEALTTKLLSQATSVHPENQQLLARVLSDLISSHMSGFTRRLVLQLLLENEKVLVCIDRPAVNASGEPSSALPHPHPSLGIGHKQHLLLLSTDTTISDILLGHLASASDIPSMVRNSFKPGQSKSVSTSEQSERDPSQLWEIQETLSATLTAGNTAKDKRLKDVKNCAVTSKPIKKRSLSTSADNSVLSFSQMVWSVKHDELTEELPHSMTLSQLLYLYPPTTPYLKLSITPPNSNSNSNTNEDKTSALLNTPSLNTPLQVFSQLGGLALLAHHLPAVNPETFHFPTLDRSEPGSKYMYYCEDQSDQDWVKIDYELYEDMEDINDMTEPESSSGPCKNKKSSEPASGSGLGAAVPPHSLAAFGLFLRLPGYADVLLKDKKKAMYLLRLVLGVTDDGEGGDIFKSTVARSLPTLPFHTLQLLLESTPLSTDDGALLRQTGLDIGVLHLLLTCLAYLTHLPTDLSPLCPAGFQPAVQMSSSSSNQKLNSSSTGSANTTLYNKSDDKSHLYWAKGTGFGTGSTTQNWNIEHALSRQRLEEEHVTALLRVLSAYVGPPDDLSTNSPSTRPLLPLPPLLKQLIRQSCLLPALASYLRNDSVLDMARHIPLYKGVLELIRAMARDPDLAPLLLPPPPDTPGPAHSVDTAPIYILLCNMKSCVDIYLSRLKSNESTKSKVASSGATPSGGVTGSETNKNRKVSWADQDEDLITLVDDIRGTVSLVQSLAQDRHCDTSPYSVSGQVQLSRHGLSPPPLKSLEERYLEIMRALQFDTYDMIAEQDSSGAPSGFKFTVAYHFESLVRSSGDRCHPARMKRLAQETVTLSTALPLSYSSSVFVRCDSDRLDIMKVLITGPSDTPYANGCFEFDVYFPPEYPSAPMQINLCTTGRHSVRFNPNLYNDGKVCLSILNTWHGRPEEKWNAQTSSFLQVLVSIQSLILVSEPYFNEPGYERSRGTAQGTQSSREYNANIAQATVKWAMLEQIRNPTPCFKHVIHTHFWLKRKEIAEQVKGWISELDTQVNDKRTGRSISLNTLALKRHFNFLLEELAKLEVPTGLEDLSEENQLNETQLNEMKLFTSGGGESLPVSPPCSNSASFYSQGDDEETEHILHLEHS
uniref:Dual E2 ubiquitin-conjugating enzyme/E3 ubiquitin-protein ligase BIRC6 n=1 Tax=Cacopsylla melanoneura TaxID=428564 RepID=A0A8D8V1I0_9HEMI